MFLRLTTEGVVIMLLRDIAVTYEGVGIPMPLVSQ